MPLTDYTFISEINSGSLSKVYKCRDKETNELRAVKLLDLTLYGKELWSKEIEMLTKFQYVRGIIKMYEYGKYIDQDSNHTIGYIILELCDSDLRDVPLEKSQHLKFLVWLLKTLYLVHQCGYVLCDLKLENVLRIKDGFRICDLASCQQLGIETSEIVGTNCVLAYEVCLALKKKQKIKYTEKIDVWNAACIFFEFLTGTKPFDCCDDTDDEQYEEKVHNNIMHNEPDFSLIENEQLRKVVQGALVKDPKKRKGIKELAMMLI